MPFERRPVGRATLARIHAIPLRGAKAARNGLLRLSDRSLPSALWLGAGGATGRTLPARCHWSALLGRLGEDENDQAAVGNDASIERQRLCHATQHLCKSTHPWQHRG